jgi:iron-sulfur cluster assembly accessory protein
VLTPQAIAKVREIMATQDPLPAGLRIGVVGGGCSGFQYSMAFENQGGMMDKVFNFEDLKVFVDATSLMYLNGCTVDYVETLEAAGFKFENPQVKSTCGCGSSFRYRRDNYWLQRRSRRWGRNYPVGISSLRGSNRSARSRTALRLPRR